MTTQVAVRAVETVRAPAATPSVDAGRDPIVVVGSGPAGVRFTERLCSLGAPYAVRLLGDEPWRPYDRVRLSSLVARDVIPDALVMSRTLDDLEPVTIFADRRIVRIDRARKRVLDQHGESFDYAKLVLATGSRPRIPPIPGLELAGVYAFRSMADAERMLARQVGSRSTVVIGGGLLGLEAARAMRRFGTRVTVVEHESRLMFHQLDTEASSFLAAHMERLGISVHVGESVQQIVGAYTPQCVRLRSGSEIECDTVIVATGIVPNVELAREAGIAVGRGIRVDDQMRTSDEDVYAVGECCEHRGEIYGLVGPGLEQAGVAANHIAGGTALYRGSLVASSLKVAGCPVFSMGEIENSARSFRAHVYRADGIYRRINVFRGRVIGAAGFGDWDVARLRTTALERRRVWPWQLWRFRLNGTLWRGDDSDGIAAWAATATVCTCRGLTRAELERAIAQGAQSVDALGASTGASTVCGSCRPLLAALLGGASPRLPIPKALLAGSLLAALIAAIASIVSLPYADTMHAGWRWDLLWTESTYKQVSGYALLGVSVLVSAVSVRKRVRRFTWARYSSWRLAHVLVGLVAIGVLLVHTGFRAGSNLNAWLTASFAGLLIAGGLAGMATALGQSAAGSTVRTLKNVSFWMHVVFLWPLPVLLGFHIFKGYYF